MDLAAAQLAAALERAEEDGDDVVIDLGECEFIDSAGIAAIVRGHQRARERGGRVAAYGASSQVHRILAMAGLTDNGLVFKSLPEALNGRT